MKLALKPFTEKDIPQFYEWMKSESEEMLTFIDGVTFGRPITIEGITNYHNNAISKKWLSFKFLVDGEIIGHIELIRLDLVAQTSAIGYVYIRRDRRGVGFGKKMLELLLLHAKIKIGLKYLDLLVGENNNPAQHFYKKCGFGYSGKTLEKGGTNMLVMYIKFKY